METNKHKRALVEAVAWRTHLTDTEAQTTADFERWLAADPEHPAAWRRVESPWNFLTEQAHAPEVLEWRREALVGARSAGRQRWRQPAGAWSRTRIGLAAGVAFAAMGIASLWMLDRSDTYRTSLGERHTATLSDGSQLVLDSDTEVRVAYSDSARTLELIRGQAKFEVAADVERPFSVSVHGQKVVALGTTFNIDRLGKQTRVTLMDGRIVVLSRHAKQGIALQPGKQLLATDAGPPTVRSVSLEVTSAWESGQLAFDNEPLSSAIERVNRYASRQIEVADARAATLKVSGLFNAGDTDGFVGTITHYLPLKAEPGRANRIRLKHR